MASMIVYTNTPSALADGTPDIALSKDMPGETLYGTPSAVTLTASNGSGTDGFNLSFNDILPPGTSLVSSDPTPTSTFTDGSGNLVLIWENVADLQDGTTYSVSYEFLAGSATYSVGDTVTNNAGAFVNSDPRLVPDFDPSTGAATGDYTGNAAAIASTDLVPFILTKEEPSEEDELLRGVHDHRTIYTLTVDNNLIDATNDFQLEDYLPAGIEFLGCGVGDNTTGGAEEYPGAGGLNTGGAPAFPNGCVTPSIVETVSTDPDGAGPMPTDVYTHVVWTAADLGGDADQPASGSFSIDYVAAIPLQENVLFPGGTDTSGLQGSNLDNNTGGLTSDEQSLENYASATGTYSGDGGTYVDGDIERVVAEDVSVHKHVDTGTIVQTGVSTWDMVVETSEYATNTTNITLTDTLPDGLCPVAPGTPCAGAAANPNPALASATENGDGTWTLVWNLADLPAPSSTTTVTFSTVAEADYVGGGAGPVAANDSWQNTVGLTSDSDIITSTTGSTTNLPIPDESSAGQTAGGISILKSVSQPVAGTLTCGDGSAVTWDPAVEGDYRPGDRVCWKLELDFPALLDTINIEVTDHLPAGFEFESAQFGANHDATGFAFDGATPVPTWSTSGVDIGGQKFEAVVSSLITDPTAAGDGDILSNLMKTTYENTAGSVFQLRDLADATWTEPEPAIVKGVSAVDGAPVAGAPADGVQIQGGDAVTYDVIVSNDGGIDADDTSVRDVLPSGITCSEVSGITGAGTCDGVNDWIQWDGLTIAAGGSTTLQYDITYPSAVVAGDTFDNNAGVRSYTSPTNRANPDDTFTYVPSSNIDPTLEASANVPPIDDPSDVFVASPTLDKSLTTSIVETGNSAVQATIGEDITYTVDLVIPEGTTIPAGAELRDAISTRLGYTAGTATVTLNGGALPGGFTLDDTAGAISIDFDSDYTNVADSGDDTIRIVFTASVLDVATNLRTGSLVPNTATFDWSGGSLSDNGNTGVVEPNLSITKADDDVDGVVDPGQGVTYTITVTNTNGTRVSPSHDTELVDTVPVNITPTLPIPDGGVWDGGGRTITWSLGSINPGSSQIRTYDAVVADPLVGSSTIVNTAVVTGSSISGSVGGERGSTSPNGGVGSGYQATTQNTLTAPNLRTSKSAAPGTATVGEVVTYTLDVTIPADVILYDATIIDDTPVGVVYDGTVTTSCDQGGSACSPSITVTELGSDGDHVGWFLGDLDTPAAADRVVTITYGAYLDDVVQVADGSTLTNTANAHGNQSDTIGGVPGSVPDPSTFDTAGTPDTADVDVVEPTLTIDKDVNGQNADDDTRRAIPGESLTYTLTIANTGSSPAHDIEVTDTPDARMTLGTVADGAGYTVVDGDPSDGSLQWVIAGPLADGDSSTITYTLVVPSGLDEADEVNPGAEIVNTADVPSYWGVAPGDQTPGYPYREYDDVTPDTVSVELDLASIGDHVWFDVNNDGVQDVGEPPIAGVDITVTYAGADGVFGTGDDEVFTDTTDASGQYLVDQLPGGTYRVEVDGADIASGYEPSYDLDDGTTDPDGRWEGSLAEDGAKRDVDFGYTGSGSIGDTVWFDQDGDGTVSGTEVGIEGVDVEVVWAGPDNVFGNGDDVTYAAMTDASGTYLVDGLPPGEYTVTVDDTTLPTGFAQVSDPDSTLDHTTDVTLAADEDHVDADFGYWGAGSIGDTIWLDLDNDGLLDTGEPGPAGVMVDVTWFGPDGVAGGGDDVTFTATTDPDGLYLVDHLPPGEYEVVVTGGLPGGLTNTYDEDGNMDSTAPVSLGDGEDHLTADFGYFGTTSLGDRVWWDLNADGGQDAGEPGLPGVEVTATFAGADGIFGNADDEVFVMETDTDGDYLFTNLPDGDYRVEITGGVASGLANTYDEDDGTGSPDESTDVPGLVGIAHLTADFGYVGAGSIGDTVWYDLDADGAQGPLEDGIAGVDVVLTWFGPDGVAGGGDDISLTTTTDAGGGYLFDGLPPGEYDVTVDDTTLPVGLVPIFDLDGTPDGSTDVTLGDGEGRTDVDFGYYGDGSVGDTIWLDLDGDGARDAGEPGIPGVTVTVSWEGADGILGTADDVIATVVTDSNGTYLVEGLLPGDHQVDVSGLPADLVPSFDPDGGDDDTSQLTLVQGEANLDQDFGYTGSLIGGTAATIGDTIWIDLDDDGTLDPDEPGVAGVAVTVVSSGVDGVLGTGDDIEIEVVTDADGTYLVAGLPSGPTLVRYDTDDLPAGLAPSGDLDGGNLAEATVTLAPGGERLDVDFPVVGTSTLEGAVWHDTDYDGVYDSGEDPVAGVTVEVVWDGPDGPVTFTVVTDADGGWSLEDIPAGDYTATIIEDSIPNDWAPTTTVTVSVTVPAGGSGYVEHGVNDPATASIGSLVWIDRDRDGIRDDDESGIPGVRVTLYDDQGDVVATMTTAPDGSYLFQGLPPGTYTVEIDPDTIPEGLIQVADRDAALDFSTTVTIEVGENILDANFGFDDADPVLPFTGLQAVQLVAGGLLALLAGATLLWVSGRSVRGQHART